MFVKIEFNTGFRRSNLKKKLFSLNNYVAIERETLRYCDNKDSRSC